jgi:hypothetical protein
VVNVSDDGDVPQVSCHARKLTCDLRHRRLGAW